MKYANYNTHFLAYINKLYYLCGINDTTFVGKRINVKTNTAYRFGSLLPLFLCIGGASR